VKSGPRGSAPGPQNEAYKNTPAKSSGGKTRLLNKVGRLIQPASRSSGSTRREGAPRSSITIALGSSAKYLPLGTLRMLTVPTTTLLVVSALSAAPFGPGLS
jgi:hypothetical protein